VKEGRASGSKHSKPPQRELWRGPGTRCPSQQGFNICNPGGPDPGTSSPFQMIAAATSGTAQVQLMELWADGKKVAQANGTPFDEPVSLGAGTHTLTFVEHDTTGTEIKSAPFQ
jgi:hypothetical protein